jgi:hypothetical protein
MAINSVSNLAGIASKLSIPQLQQAIQDGTIPSYIGIPALQQKVQMQQRGTVDQAAAQPQQPTVAQQVMQQAQAVSRPMGIQQPRSQGVAQLASNLPDEYAGGGIVAFADGDLVEDDEEDPEDKFDKSMQAMLDQISHYREIARQMRDEGSDRVVNLPAVGRPTSFTTEEITKGLSYKKGDEPAQSMEKTEKRVSRPGGLEDLLALVKQKESGGRRYDAQGNLLTSPKGAMGEMQVMPGTASAPGFGIRPARAGDAEDLARVGREYYGAMLNKYGDPKLAAIAYNMGPAATDKWIMAGADMSKLPAETRNYSQGFAKGGIASFAGGALVPYETPGVSSLDPYSYVSRGPSSGVNQITPEAQQMKDEAVKRLQRLRQAAASSAAAPSAGPSTVGPADLASQASPWQRMTQFFTGARPAGTVGGSLAGPASLVGAGGTAATGLAGGILGGASPEGLQQLTGDIGSDTGLAAAIMGQARANQPPPQISPVPPAKKPIAVQTPAAPAQAPAAGIDMLDNSYTAGQDEQDRLATALPGYDLSQPANIPAPAQAETAAAPTESPFAQRLRDRIEKGYDKLDKQEAIDNYLALMQAGLGIMSGTSPSALINLGRGGMQGVQSLMQSNAARGAQEKALMSAELGLERYSQYGEMQKELRTSREETAKAERERKERATEATLAEKAEGRKLREQQMYAKQLSEMERLATNAALAREKGAIMPDQKEGIQAKALNDLRTDAGYRQLYKLVHGFDPVAGTVGNTIKWDQLK